MRALVGPKRELRILMQLLPGQQETARDLLWIKSIKNKFQEALGDYETTIDDALEEVIQVHRANRGRSLNVDSLHYDPDYRQAIADLDDQITALDKVEGKKVATIYLEESDFGKIKDRFFARKGLSTDDKSIDTVELIADALEGAQKVKPKLVVPDTSKDLQNNSPESDALQEAAEA